MQEELIADVIADTPIAVPPVHRAKHCPVMDRLCIEEHCQWWTVIGAIKGCSIGIMVIPAIARK